jgi:hypothetical protein
VLKHMLRKSLRQSCRLLAFDSDEIENEMTMMMNEKSRHGRSRNEDDDD